MADESPETKPDGAPPQPSDAGTAAKPGENKQPPLTISGQYVKDLSFENPRAPTSLLQPGTEQPNVGIAVNVLVQNLQDKVHEVTLALRGEAKRGEDTLFLAEVQYAGIFTVGDVPQEYVAALLYIEAPRLLFPFARAIIADCVRDGGFPPLMVQPIDFVALYQQRAAQQQSGAATAGAAPAAAAAGAEKADPAPSILRP